MHMCQPALDNDDFDLCAAQDSGVGQQSIPVGTASSGRMRGRLRWPNLAKSCTRKQRSSIALCREARRCCVDQ